MSISYELKNSSLQFSSEARTQFGNKFERVSQQFDRIPVSESPGGILRSQYQVGDCLVIFAATLEMQGKFCCQLWFLRSAKVLEALAQKPVQLRPAHIGKLPVEDFPVK